MGILAKFFFVGQSWWPTFLFSPPLPWKSFLRPWSCTDFLLDLRCLKSQSSFFRSCLSRVIVHLRNISLLSTRVARTFLTRRRVSWQKDVKLLFINLSKLTAGHKHFINHRTTFSPNLHLVEEKTLEYLPILQH